MNSLAPIVLFTYNRPTHLRRTLDALLKNQLAIESEIYIYSDGPKNDEAKLKVEEVRSVLNSLVGFKKIDLIFRETNVGLANNIIDGVTKTIEKFGKVIVLEDDLVTAPYFLKFMNTALDLYENAENISQVVGYSYYQKFSKRFHLSDGVFIRGADCLGWGTWKRAWKKFNPDGKQLVNQLQQQNLVNDFNFGNTYNYFEMLERQSQGLVNSWAIRWMASAFLENMYSYFPTKSLVLHIGNDEEASNYNSNKRDPLDLPLYSEDLIPKYLEFSEELLEHSRLAHIEYLKGFRPTLIEKVKTKLFHLKNKIYSILRF